MQGRRWHSMMRSKLVVIPLVRVTKLPWRSEAIVVIAQVQVERMSFGNMDMKQKVQALRQVMTPSKMQPSKRCPILPSSRST